MFVQDAAAAESALSSCQKETDCFFCVTIYDFRFSHCKSSFSVELASWMSFVLQTRRMGFVIVCWEGKLFCWFGLPRPVCAQDICWTTGKASFPAFLLNAYQRLYLLNIHSKDFQIHSDNQPIMKVTARSVSAVKNISWAWPTLNHLSRLKCSHLGFALPAMLFQPKQTLGLMWINRLPLKTSDCRTCPDCRSFLGED